MRHLKRFLLQLLASMANLNISRSMLSFMIALCVVRLVKCQFSPNWQVPDDFQQEMCRERWHRLDWQKLLQPCIDRTVFGENMLPKTLGTKATWSRTLSMNIKSAGEYSKLVIQSVDQLGRVKTIGGDSWRVLITGPSSLQPVVYDMNNGLYEVLFLLLEPGFYKADVFLEGTLCNQLFDPPADWFRKGDYNGHFQEDHMYSDKQGWSDLLKERIWDRLGGHSAVIQFQINPITDQFRFAGNMAKLEQAQQVCNLPASCDFVWDGFGRWIGQEWKPYNRQDETLDQLSIAKLQNSHRRKRGTLWFYGDCFAYHFYEMEHNQTLCKNVFKSCDNSYNWVYLRAHSKPNLDPNIHRKDRSDISIKKILTALRKVLQKSNMKKDSALVLNYGLHFARSTSFVKYQKLILGAIKELDAYEGQVIWRSTTAVWKQHWKVHKRFQTNQRIQLFNAFAASSFCNAGYPVLDMYPMTSSTSYQPDDGIHYESWITKPIEKVVAHEMNFILKEASPDERPEIKDNIPWTEENIFSDCTLPHLHLPSGSNVKLSPYLVKWIISILKTSKKNNQACLVVGVYSTTMMLNGYAVFLMLLTRIVISAFETEDIRIAEKADKNYEFAVKKILTGYNPGTRPNVTGAPIIATVDLHILKVEEIEEVHETFTVDLYLRITWNDYRLRHNQSKITLQAEHASKIWSPDIFFPNALKSNAPKVTKENQYVYVDSTGEVVHSKRVSLTANCHLHLRSFPLDKQKCWMHLESYSHHVYDVILKWRNSKPVFIEDKRMPGYEITSIDISSQDVFYIGGNFSRLSVITTYTRLIGYYVFQIYIPCTLIVVSSWLSFWLSIDEPGDRVALLITTVLAIVFLLQFISATLPKVHYAKGIDYYLIGCFAQVFLGLLETVIATNYVKKQDKSNDGLKARINTAQMNGRIEPNTKLQHHNPMADEISLDGFAVDMVTKEKPECDFSTATATNKEKECDQANMIDRVSRVAFPLTFGLFNLIYWVIYIYVIEY